MRTALRIIAGLVLALVFVAGGAILALPTLFSTDLVKSKVAGLVEQKTGRKLVIGGDTSFRLFPDIAVSLDKIALLNPPAMKGDPLVIMASLRANLKLWPLFKGRAEIKSLTLIQPRFLLLVDKKGRRNWEFGSHQGPDSDGASPSSGAGGKALTFGTVTIKNGFVRYLDETSGLDEKFKDINITLTQKKSDRSLKTKGNLRWRNEVMNFTTALASPDALMAGQPSQVRFRLNSHLIQSEYDGLLRPGDKAGLDGVLVLDTPSVRRLAEILGQELPAGSGFGKLKVRTKLTAGKDRISFKTEQLLFDNMELGASGKISLAASPPDLTLDLTADSLNFNPYLGDDNNKSASGAAAGGGAGSDKESPVDLSGLKALNGRISLKTDQILYRKARLGEGRFKINLKDGRATINIEHLSLYRGTGEGTFTLDGRKPVSRISGNLVLRNVLTGAILRDFAGFDKLAGKGNIATDFTTRGQNVTALKQSLKGKLNLELRKGRLEGFDLARYVEDLTGNQVPGAGEGHGGKPMTAYDKMSALIKINKGVARNTDFLLTGKFFRVRAAGTIDLVREDLRLRVAPQLFSGDWKFAPPLRVRGNWASPKVSFDALAFLGGQGGVVRSLGGLLRGESLDLGSVLKNRGLQTDDEIESYLAGKKIDTSKDRPAPVSEPDSGTETPSTDSSGNPANPGPGGTAGPGNEAGSALEGLLGGNKKKDGGALLNQLFQ